MIKKVLSLYLVWLIIINLFAYYALNRLNLTADTAYPWLNPQEFHQIKELDLVNLRVHWDSFWYLKIAQEGYSYIPGQMTSIAFFPLYPSLIWLVSQLMIAPALAGWVISTVVMGIGLVFLYKLVKEFHPGIDPFEPVILLLIYPTAFFLNAVYTESLFLTLSIICFYYLLKKKFLLAAIFIALASVTRINGVFLLVPFLVEYLQTYGIKRFRNPDIISFLVAPIGIICFLIYQYIMFGEPLAVIKSQMEWGRKFTFNGEHFQLFSPPAYSNLATDLLFLGLAVVASFYLIRKIRLSYGLYVLTTVLVAISTGTLMSMSRFTLILFPIFILIASVKHKTFKFGWQLASILLLAIFTTLFVNNYWAG